MGKDPDVDDVSLPALNKRGDAAVYNVTSQSSPVSERTVELVNRLRDDVIPGALKGDGLGRPRSSADRPPPTSTSPTGSPRSCRS